MTPGTAGNHRELVLWQKSMELAVRVHHVTARFPRCEIYGLVSQMRRAAVSIPSNIAEGAARRTTREFVAFLHVARGSHAELETQLLLSRDFGYLSGDQLIEVSRPSDEVGRLLTAFITTLSRRAGV